MRHSYKTYLISESDTDRVINLLIGVCDSIYIINPGSHVRRIDKFFMETGSGSRMGTAWYIEAKMNKLLNSLSRIVIGDNHASYDQDYVDSMSTEIYEILKALAGQSSCFDFSKLYQARNKTLLTARSCHDKKDFSRKLWDEIRPELQSKMMTWLTMHPIPRLISNSWDLGYEGVSIIEPNDGKVLGKLADIFLGMKHCSPNNSFPKVGEKHFYYGSTIKFSWLAVQVDLINNQALMISRQRMSKFLAIVLSLVYQTDPFVLRRCMGQLTPNFWQYSSCGYQNPITPAGNIVHYFRNEIFLSNKLQSEMKNYYSKARSLNEQQETRLHNATQFFCASLRQGLGIVRFILLFSVLDALFGEKSESKQSIFKGLKLLSSKGSKDVTKYDLIYDLRCELVHGGVSSIAEWSNLLKYKNTFNTHPGADLEEFVCRSIREFPALNFES